MKSKQDPFEKFRKPSLFTLPMPIFKDCYPFKKLYDKLTLNYPKPHRMHGHYASFQNSLLITLSIWKDLIHTIDDYYMEAMRATRYPGQGIKYQYVFDRYFQVLGKYFTFVFLLKISADRILPFLKYLFKNRDRIPTDSFDVHRRKLLRGKVQQHVIDKLPNGYLYQVKSKMEWYLLLKELRDKLIAHYSSHYFPKMDLNKKGQFSISLEYPDEPNEPIIYLPNPLNLFNDFRNFLVELHDLFYSFAKRNDFKFDYP